MSQNQAGISQEKPSGAVGQRIIRLVVYWIAALVIIGLGWRISPHTLLEGGLGLRAIFALGLLCVPLTVALERALSGLALKCSSRYRMAFVLSAGLPLLLVGIQWLIQRFVLRTHLGAIYQAGSFVGTLAFSLTGAFLGGVIATGLNEGWWENNSPPSEHILEEVHQSHQRIIGTPGPAPVSKRALDIFLACFGLVLSAPIWIACMFAIWWENPGPLLFVKNSVGKGGVNFHQLKFRTMVVGAEDQTGPVLSQESDERVLTSGRLLRKTALDELPQLINILRGEMSFVGPRPQRTILVHGYLQTMPEYAKRHRVLPGLAGLAQVAGNYYLTPHQKLRLDRLYIRHASLGFDLKLILLAFLVTFWYRWQRGWNGRLPRRLLRLGSKTKSDGK